MYIRCSHGLRSSSDLSHSHSALLRCDPSTSLRGAIYARGLRLFDPSEKRSFLLRWTIDTSEPALRTVVLSEWPAEHLLAQHHSLSPSVTTDPVHLCGHVPYTNHHQGSSGSSLLSWSITTCAPFVRVTYCSFRARIVTQIKPFNPLSPRIRRVPSAPCFLCALR